MEDRLYKKLEAYGKSDFYPFHMPGHKRNPLAVEGDFPVERDITEIDGFDNLHHAEDILKRAQEDVARLYGVPESFYSINGSSGAILAAVSAAVDKGGQILVARNCHKAVYHAIYLRELSATYIYPHEDPKLGINGGISPGRVEMYLAENPEIQAVLITSPTYDGIVSDVARIAEIRMICFIFPFFKGSFSTASSLYFNDSRRSISSIASQSRSKPSAVSPTAASAST